MGKTVKKKAAAKEKQSEKEPEKKASGASKNDKNTSLVIVGIGSSAGGLEALRHFVAALKPGTNMAYVIAQHMSPHHKSMMVDLLARETDLPVMEVRHNLIPVADTIYVAQPDTDVSIKDGKLQLRKPLADIGAKPSVDYLFTSMAEDLGERAIAVVMSGTGMDGSHGIRALNAAGGISIAQEPKTAKFDSMPVAAIKAGVDLVLPPDQIALQLVSINERPRVQVAAQDNENASINPMDKLVKLVFQHTKMDFSNYKLTTLTRQVERRMAVLQITDLPEYVSIAEKSENELKALVNNFLICVTSFFRDTDAFDAFKVHLTEIIKNKVPGDHIRIWVPGCATGEEAYSIGIMVSEILGRNIDQYRVQIFATDANPEATQYGRRGLYPEASIEGVSSKLLQKYFTRKEKYFQVDRSLKELVLFANQDLVQDPPFVRMDAISCRNLLIYFKTSLQDKVFRIFHYSLNPGGTLFLGKSESVGHNTNFFSEADRKLKIFKKIDIPSSLSGPIHLESPSLVSLDRRIAEPKKEPAVTPGDNGRNTLFEIYTPPSVLVTVNGDILEFYGDISPFTHLNPGKPDFSLFSILHPPLRTELRAMVQKVIRSGETVYTRPVSLKIEGEEISYRSAIRPANKKNTSSDHVIVSFEKVVHAAGRPGVELKSIDEIAEARILELEHELTVTRESLQTVIEELETSNEELQSMNEEAQASNEELQASNEELETSNEELQATNEELTTVNDELSTRSNQLADALDDMENIQNSVNRAILVLDSDLNLRRYNKEAFRYFKIEPAFARQNLSSIPLLFNLDEFFVKIRNVASSGKSHLEEFIMGNRFHEIDITPYKSENSEMDGGVIILVHDVTERALAAQELIISEGKFRSMVENAGDAIYIHDRYGKIYDVNPVAAKQTGYSREELLALNVRELDAAIEFDTLRDTWDLGLADPEKYPITLESSHRRKDGSVFPMEVRISLLPYGSEYLYVAVVRDITDRTAFKKSLDEKVRELDFQKLALDEHAIVSFTDRKGSITYVNDKFCQISGYSREELLGQNHRMLKSGEHTDEFYKDLWRTISGGKPWHGEIKNTRKDGNFYWVSATIVPFLDEKGTPFQYIAIRTDITDRVNAMVEANHANLAKSKFLSSMSHELRTPLNAIIGFSNVLEADKTSPVTENQKQNIEYIKSSGKHLLKLINEVLDLSKIEAGSISISIEPVKPEEVIASILNIMKGMAEQKHIALNIENCTPEERNDTEPCYIRVDQNRFRQIMINLISNAIKYNRENGSVTVHCEKGKTARFVVSDTGHGIPEKLQDKLFKPFSRLGTDETIEGTGIGLSISKTLAELMGGVIGFSSKENEGSSFWVEFPLVNLEDDPVEIMPGKTEKSSGSGNDRNSNTIRKVLYIEDNQINLKLMERIIENYDSVKFLSAGTAETGIETALQDKPDLIFMDINLPGMNGIEALQVIQKSEKLKDIPVIAVSANAMKDDIAKAMDCGFKAYITKPFQIEKIQNILGELN